MPPACANRQQHSYNSSVGVRLFSLGTIAAKRPLLRDALCGGRYNSTTLTLTLTVSTRYQVHRDNASKRPLGRHGFGRVRRRPGALTVWPGRFIEKQKTKKRTIWPPGAIPKKQEQSTHLPYAHINSFG